jgi:hypothetical protein
VCAANKTCSAPSPTDGVQNDSETDVDCGGALLASGAKNAASDGANPCADDKACALDTDCLSGFCSLEAHKCVDGQSCKGLVTPAKIMDPTGMVNADGDAIGTPDPNGVGQSAGLDTCGKGEATDPVGEQEHESCCRSLLIPGQTAWRLDKYEVTSGRIRQFLESLDYNVQKWALAQFDATFNPLTPAGKMLAAQLPINQAGVTTNALKLLPQSNTTTQPLNAVIVTGALVLHTTGVQGCYTAAGADGAATYWWDEPTIHAQASSPARPFTQDYYDIKPMNCIPYYLAAAFCAWDGGRLQLHSEHQTVWGTAAYPWGPNFLPNPYPGTGAIGSPNNQKMYTEAACGGANGIETNAAVGCTVDWFNGGQGVGSQGDFYYYPSWVANIPNGNVPDTLGGLDLSIYIAAPGRFFLDRTAKLSPSFAGNEGWQDLGADMIEWDSISAFTGAQQFCDQSGILGPGESFNCGGPPFNGVIRGANLPEADILGGSWEGHAVKETLAASWSFYRQYGKTGLRCARPAEPAP